MLRIFIMLLSCGVFAQSAFSIFDLQLLYGKRWFETKDNTGIHGYVAYETVLAVHVDPIPLVPISFGASYSMLDFDEDDFSADSTEIKGKEGTLEVMGWLPFVPVVTPYGRVRYTIFSQVDQELEQELDNQKTPGKVEYQVSGFHLHVGIKYSVIPLLSLMLEAGQGFQVIKNDKIKIPGFTASNEGDENDFNSQAVWLGVELAL